MQHLALRKSQPFDLDHTLGCGQVFRWNRDEKGWTGVVGNEVIRVCQENRTLKWSGTDRESVERYFALDLDLPSVLSEIDRDPVIHRAVTACRGLRIVRQEPWECLASYICATYSNIPRIRAQVEALATRFGEKIGTGPDGRMYFSFPPPDAFVSAESGKIGECRLGYRAPYLCETARAVAGDPGWVERIQALGTVQAGRELMKFRGVGRKVADCVLLFAFGRYDAVPVDVWIRKIMEHHYPGTCSPGSYGRVRQAALDHFGRYAGYAQEYLFCMREELVNRE
ncbi:MAG: 8-oxoguanine DNA glycosylase [Methanoregulaceae archaeon]|nr:8-oxoguanine DNA glycosylase [Methanoregulaceae archaeon]